MDSAHPQSARIRFGEFEADLRTEELRKGGRAVRLPNQSFVVLAMLLENRGQLVTREEIRKRLWPRNTSIEYDQALNAAVNRLREALRDSADSPKFVETLPRRGYRFIGTVEPELPASPPAEPAAANAVPAAKRERTKPVAGRLLPIAIVASIAILLGVALVRMWPTGQPPEPKLFPFTTLPHREISPAFSPNANEIAFAWDGAAGGAAGFDLYVKSVDSESMLRLTQRPAQWLSAAWSHDGRQIAFARLSGEDSGIFLVPALGGPERRLINASFTEGPLMQIAWSADDAEILYSAYGPSGLQLYRLSRNSLQSQPVLPQLSCWDMGTPAISPDGTRVAFVCTTSFALYSIHTMRIDGGDLRKLTDVQGLPEGIAWSADGARVIFATDSGDGGGLWQVTLEGNVSRLPFGEEASAPVIAPSGDRIAYVRSRKLVDIWRVDLQGTAPERSATRLISSTRQQITPQYSPDGARIAFQSNRSGSTEIWVADADGSNPVRVSSFGGPPTGAPSWCADGKRLAFDSRASGVSALYVANIDERLPRIVKTTVENLALPAWSGDCQWLIASKGNDSLYIVPAAGGPAQSFTRQSSYYAQVNDDRVVFNVKADPGVALWQKRIGEDTEQALEGLPRLSYSDSWVVSDAGVYFTLVADDPRQVRFYDFRTRQVSPVVRLSKPATPMGGLGFSVSPDRRYLLYTQTEDQQSDIMLISGF